MASDQRGAETPVFVRLTLADPRALCAAYMPFIREGGLFLPQSVLGASSPVLGQTLHLLLALQDPAMRWPVVGSIVWLCPSSARGAAGVGIQLSGSIGKALKARIEHWQDEMATRDGPAVRAGMAS